jgi:hypothetical protein
LRPFGARSRSFTRLIRTAGPYARMHPAWTAAIGADRERLLSWCKAFAGTCALELAESSTGTSFRVDALAALAVQA